MTTIQKVNKIFDRNTKVKCIILLIAIIFGSLIEMFALAIIYPFIELLLDDSILYSNRYIIWINNLLGFNNSASLLAFMAILLAIVYIFKGVYSFILKRASIRFTAYKQAEYSNRLLTKIIDFSYLYHTHKNIAEIQRIINRDVSDLFTMLLNLIHLLSDFFMTIFMLTYLFYVSPFMTLCVLCLTLLCAIIYFLLFRKSIQKAGRMSRVAGIETNKSIYQIFGGIKEVKLLKRENHFKNIFNTARNKLLKSFVKYHTINALPAIILNIVCFSGAFIILGFSILSGADISSFVAQLGLFVVAAFRILPAVTTQISGASAVLYQKPSIDAVYKNLFEEEDIAVRNINDDSLNLYNENQNNNADVSSSSSNGISVCNVSFSYPGTNEIILDNVSFTIPENKSVALVGPSGIGKTTLADIVLGVLTPNEGVILYNGHPIYNNTKWSETIGYIPQSIYLLDESILANIAFGIDENDVSEEKAWKALEQAQLKTFVERLPDSINTVVGDRGIRLSGGQRQRIGIARAIYEDPPVLVLDEATSSLDNETEKAVMDAIKGFHGNKTILIVAHRLTTIEHCDIIYRVEKKGVFRER